MGQPDSLIAELSQRQNADGGWSYRRGQSWTEPTSYSVMALDARGEQPLLAAAGRQWLRDRQNQDGGWSPIPDVSESTWVTSVAVLALPDSAADGKQRNAGLRWILRETSADGSIVEKLRRRLLGLSVGNEAPNAWPWFPGTASWVTPTALSMIALRGCELQEAKDRLKTGAEFLMKRRCPDGGWNHGGTPVRSENAISYPETTGLAVLALKCNTGPEISRALRRAEVWLRNPGSSEGLAWLRLGMRAHGHAPPSYSPLRCWTVSDLALTLLADSERSPLL